MTPTLTPREKELARHALGLDGRRKRSCRNGVRVVASTAHGKAWTGLVERGLAKSYRAKGARITDFYLTRAGAEAALNPDESLDEEDFPK